MPKFLATVQITVHQYTNRSSYINPPFYLVNVESASPGGLGVELEASMSADTTSYHTAPIVSLRRAPRTMLLRDGWHFRGCSLFNICIHCDWSAHAVDGVVLFLFRGALNSDGDGRDVCGNRYSIRNRIFSHGAYLSYAMFEVTSVFG